MHVCVYPHTFKKFLIFIGNINISLVKINPNVRERQNNSLICPESTFSVQKGFLFITDLLLSINR